MKKLVFALLFLSGSCFANPGSWTPTYQKISGIIVQGANQDGEALLAIEGGVPIGHIPGACNSGGSNSTLSVPLNTDKGRAIYSMALASYMAGKSIRLALACNGDKPLITHIWLK